MKHELSWISGFGKPLTLPAACLALGIACAGADVNGDGIGGNGAGNNGAGNSSGGNSGAGNNGVGIGGFPGMLDGIPADGEGCNDTKFSPEKVTPTVALLIDRSSSMTAMYGGSGTRWDVLKKVVLDPVTGIIKPREGEIRFGLTTYTSLGGAAMCPSLENVAFQFGNYDQINAAYAASTTPAGKGDTPTAEAVRFATEQLLAVQEKGPKYILLATDGEPDTCAKQDPNCGQDESVGAVADAYTKGIKTFVVAIGDEVGEPHLRALANAGQGLQPVLGQKMYEWLRYTCSTSPSAFKGKYIDVGTNPSDPNSTELRIVEPMQAPAQAEAYRPENAEALARDLSKILTNVSDCKFRLKGEVLAGKETQGTVYLDNMPLKLGDPDGWKLISPTEVQLLGKACEETQRVRPEGEKKWELVASFPCGSFNPE